MAADAHAVMAEQLGQAGFFFSLDVESELTAVCDREALVQVLVRTTKGTGIGLAIVRKLVQAMGGRIRAMNGADGGCVMEITLQSAGGRGEEGAGPG